MNPRVVSVNPLNNYCLALEFSNGEKKLFDVKAYLDQGIFKDLRNNLIFHSVKVVDGTVEWQNGADFCPDTLYLESKIV